MDDVGAVGRMDGQGDCLLIGLQNQRRVREVEGAGLKVAPDRFSDPGVLFRPLINRLVEELAGLSGHSKGSRFELFLDIFGSGSTVGNLKVVNDDTAIHCDRGNESLLQQLDEERSESRLDDMASQGPDDGTIATPGGSNAPRQILDIGRGQDVRQRGQELLEAVSREGSGEVGPMYLAGTVPKRIVVDSVRSKLLMLDTMRL